MALLLSSALLGFDDSSLQECGFDPSPSDGRGCGGRRKYIPQTASINALHAIPGATSVASLTPSLDIHVEPFGPQKALLFVGCADRASPSHARRAPCHPKATHMVRNRGERGFSLDFTPPSLARLSWFRQPPVSNSMSSNSLCEVLHPSEVDSSSLTHYVSRRREAVGSAGVRGRDAEPGAYRDVFTASAAPTASRRRRIEATASKGTPRAKMRITGS